MYIYVLLIKLILINRGKIKLFIQKNENKTKPKYELIGQKIIEKS